MVKGMEKTWGALTIFEIWLFCTACDCRLDLNDGKITSAVCKPRKELHES